MKRLFLTIALGAMAMGVFAQKHLKGSTGVGLEGGVTGLGFYAAPVFNYFLNNKGNVKAEFIFESAKFQEYSLTNFSLNAGYNYTPFNIKNVVYFYGAAGLQFDFTQIPELESTTTGTEDYSGMGVGVYLGAETEFYVHEKINFVLNFKQVWYPYNKMSEFLEEGKSIWVFYAGGGLRYNF